VADAKNDMMPNSSHAGFHNVLVIYMPGRLCTILLIFLISSSARDCGVSDLWFVL
jgi:hypothetical protein